MYSSPTDVQSQSSKTAVHFTSNVHPRSVLRNMALILFDWLYCAHPMVDRHTAMLMSFHPSVPVSHFLLSPVR